MNLLQGCGGGGGERQCRFEVRNTFSAKFLAFLCGIYLFSWIRLFL